VTGAAVKRIEIESEPKTGDGLPLVARADYAKVLSRSGLEAELAAPWLSVGESRRVQGWKLHVSATVTGASDVLERVVPLLAARCVSFKVAASPATLVRLNDGSLGQSQIGKFMTIYPESDAQARELAMALRAVVEGCEGPDIVTDLWLGGVLYARRGAFRPHVERDRLGQLVRTIENEAGARTVDSYSVSEPDEVTAAHPFEGLAVSRPRSTGDPGKGRLFGPGYFLADVLQANAKGSVFRGLDVRNATEVRSVVIKEARVHCCSDFWGRDMRSRLEHQYELHRGLCGSVPVPEVFDLFAVAGQHYLAMQHIEGTGLGQLMAGRWDARIDTEREALWEVFAELACAVRDLHAVGYVHRDLKPSNVRVDVSGKVWLLDLELAARVDDDAPAYQLGTPGYMSPQQAALAAPVHADDVYSLGAMMLQALVGLHPDAVLSAGQIDRNERIRALACRAEGDLLDLVCSCVDERPDRRPDAASVAACLFRRVSARRDQRLAAGRLALQHGGAGLVRIAARDERDEVWLSDSLDRPGTPEALISASRGVAGPLYVSARLSRAGEANADLVRRAELAARWLMSSPRTSDALLPGLHFGRAGVAVALAEAEAAGIVERDAEFDAFVRQQLAGEIDWPDMTHGAAGQGLAALHCARVLADPTFGEAARACARYLVDLQDLDGSWPLPAGSPAIQGERFCGLAHGAAGVVYFLAEYSRDRADSEAAAAWQHGIEWLVGQAIERSDSEAMAWPWSDTNPTIWNWWCHGSTGIALVFLRLFEVTEDERFATLARRALREFPECRGAPSLGQCHGLSGYGEACLEAARVLGDSEWMRRSDEIGNILVGLRREHGESMCTWSVDGAPFPTADLQVGNAGVLHFLLRWTHPDAFGPPLLAAPGV